MKLLEFTSSGIFCSQAGVYIDPWKPVEKAIITHAHSDHARQGSGAYLCHIHTKPLLEWRFGDDATIESVAYNRAFTINGVRFSLHPAGHIVGSAQVRVEYKGEVWTVSGDYKLEPDGLSMSFEPVKCDVFITESTFGLPVFQWKRAALVYDEINAWWRQNQAEGMASVLTGYVLGKAQRLLQNLDLSTGPVYAHGAINNINRIIAGVGLPLKTTLATPQTAPKESFGRALILAPPYALNTPWMQRFLPCSTAIASGWMNLRGARRRRSVDRGFALSDHADWRGLQQAINETGARKVIITHGYRNTFARWLKTLGIEAEVAVTSFEGELGEIGESAAPEEKE